MSVSRRRQRIGAQQQGLSVSQQWQLLHISRNGLYYRAKGESGLSLALMRLIDEKYLKCPWYGSRQMTRYLKRQGYCVGRKPIRRLTQLMGLVAICPGPQTSRRRPKHPVFPYLLRNLSVCRANQVWCTDVTYLSMAHGLSTCWRSWTGILDTYYPGGYRRLRAPVFVCKGLRKLSRNMARQISSTLTRAVSSRVQPGSMN